MAYNEDGRKSRSSNKKRVVKYKASKGADFDDEGTGSGHITKSIKTKTKYDKKGEIKKIKRVKKTEGGGRMVTVSKPGIENNSLSPEGATGLVTTRQKTNTAFDNPRAGSNSSKNRIKSMVDKVNGPKKSKNIYGEASGTQSEEYTKKDGSKSDVYRRGSKTKGYLAPGTEDSPRYESGRRASHNPQSPGYGKKNRNVEVMIDQYGSTRQKGGKAKNISEKRANRIIDRYGRRKDRQ